MTELEFLRHIEKKLHQIASDSFDLHAKQHLRELQHEVVSRRIAVPPRAKDAPRDREAIRR